MVVIACWRIAVGLWLPMAASGGQWLAMTELAAQKATWTQLLLSVGIACCKEKQSKERQERKSQKSWAGEVIGLWLVFAV